MNIFFLDSDPDVAARYHCNKHVLKMIVESAQLLSAAHWWRGYSGPNHVEHGSGPYKFSRSAKPTLGPMRWIMESLANYRWTVSLGLALAAEYTRRYRGTHKSQAVLEWLRDNEPAMPDVGLTPFITSDLRQYSVPGNPIESYRRYYIGDKHTFAKWPKGETPDWFAAGVREIELQKTA